MKYLLFFLLFGFVLLQGCNRPNKPTIATHPEELALIIGNPVDYGLDSVLAFPVGANYNPKLVEKEKESSESVEITKSQQGLYAATEDKLSFKKRDVALYDKNASSEFFNEQEEDFDIRNILFYAKENGNTFPLTNDTLHILSFAIHKEFANPLIFYRVVKRDINLDKKYNSKDAVMLYTSKLNGKEFTQITPENEQYFDYFYYPEKNVILIKTAIDIDNDKKFTEIDETNFRELKLNAPAMGREIFSKSLKDSLRNQINQLQ
ncbi:MAG: hypothetical protein K1X55_01020 [Chitinophagales bacterium]|nr:hypothetical protein [Chitinophagales bacterium]